MRALGFDSDRLRSTRWPGDLGSVEVKSAESGRLRRLIPLGTAAQHQGRDSCNQAAVEIAPASCGDRACIVVEGATLHLGDMELAFPDRSGDASFQ